MKHCLNNNNIKLADNVLTIIREFPGNLQESIELKIRNATLEVELEQTKQDLAKASLKAAANQTNLSDLSLRNGIVELYRFLRTVLQDRNPMYSAMELLELAFKPGSLDKKWAANMIADSNLDVNLMENLFNLNKTRDTTVHQLSLKDVKSSSETVEKLEVLKETMQTIPASSEFFALKDALLQQIGLILFSLHLILIFFG